jgi:hypothetical protein
VTLLNSQVKVIDEPFNLHVYEYVPENSSYSHLKLKLMAKKKASGTRRASFEE